MGISGSYGDAFGQRFGVEAAPSFVTRTLSKTEIAVTYLDLPNPTHEMSEPQPVADAYLVSMGFLNFPDYHLFEQGRAVRSAPVIAPQVTLYDLRAAPAIIVNQRMVGVHFHLPRAAFNALADNSGVARIGDLHYPRGWGVDDPVIHHLGLSLMPAFQNPQQANRLFIDHVTLAVCVHVAATYGGMQPTAPKRGGLAPWQLKLATEMLNAHLAGDISHAQIAQQCGLSPSHFARAFRISTGLAPHQWLLRRRVERAKDLLRDPTQPLTAIAFACGFADQSHFTRVFSAIAGIPPGEWRRRIRS